MFWNRARPESLSLDENVVARRRKFDETERSAVIYIAPGMKAFADNGQNDCVPLQGTVRLRDLLPHGDSAAAVSIIFYRPQFWLYPLTLSGLNSSDNVAVNAKVEPFVEIPDGSGLIELMAGKTYLRKCDLESALHPLLRTLVSEFVEAHDADTLYFRASAMEALRARVTAPESGMSSGGLRVHDVSVEIEWPDQDQLVGVYRARLAKRTDRLLVECAEAERFRDAEHETAKRMATRNTDLKEHIANLTHLEAFAERDRTAKQQTHQESIDGNGEVSRLGVAEWVEEHVSAADVPPGVFGDQLREALGLLKKGFTNEVPTRLRIAIEAALKPVEQLRLGGRGVKSPVFALRAAGIIEDEMRDDILSLQSHGNAGAHGANTKIGEAVALILMATSVGVWIAGRGAEDGTIRLTSDEEKKVRDAARRHGPQD